ncbi:unnamed protein product [Parnassius apollo]|uniref:(apollo) hypothetical protein n=1 Tax=Parnassius apollo TaxID=110799 RepID=A0A8S3WU03_PARAO|nr:unnamed protein product [Parnassius apollo]
MNFGSLCKRFNELINTNHVVWKHKFKFMYPVIFEVAEKFSDGNWLNDFKDFMKHKQLVYRELITMSPKHYWKIDDITPQDVSYFFEIASTNSRSYYYTIYILQDIIRKGNKVLNNFQSKKPYTLTEIHYAKSVVRCLIHCYMAVKWVKAQISHELPPEIVINYFLQWIDTVNLHLNEDVEDQLQHLANKVKIHLDKMHSDQLVKSNDKRYTPGQIFIAVSQVLFHQRHMALTTIANLDTLDIVKIVREKNVNDSIEDESDSSSSSSSQSGKPALKRRNSKEDPDFEDLINQVWAHKYGNQIVVFAIFQAVAKRCGAECELIVFSNHLFLEWRSDESEPNAQVFTINVATGELEPKRRCPFAQSNQNARYKYSADSLLQCLHSSFLKTMGAIKSWMTQNASDLLGFLGGNNSIHSQYDIFYKYLFRLIDMAGLNSNLNLKNLTERELQIISMLVHVSTGATNKAVKISKVKKHHSGVLFAVGMICYHKEHEYVCIIRGWDLTCGPEWRASIPKKDLSFGHKQPFYHVLAADQSDRYVAQENLIALTHPTRLYHLEEFVAKEFLHFDGFSYVLNDEKRLEYPDEDPIVEVFRRRSHVA